jgi:hypothetical protein
VSNAPAASYAKVKSIRVSHHRFTGSIRPSLRNGFNGFLRALLGDRAFLSPSLTDHPANLTPASGRLLPAFRSSCAIRGPTFTKLRKARGNSNCLMPVPLTILKFLYGIAANSGGTSKSAALVPHDFAVRMRAARLATLRVHRISSNVRDDGQRPSFGRDGCDSASDLRDRSTRADRDRLARRANQ